MTLVQAVGAPSPARMKAIYVEDFRLIYQAMKEFEYGVSAPSHRPRRRRASDLKMDRYRWMFEAAGRVPIGAHFRAEAQ